MKLSAGLLVYRRKGDVLEVLLVHPGGPFWKNKEVWGLPKGEYIEQEDAAAAARREFHEELNLQPPEGQLIDLGEIKISGKKITAWAVEGDLDVSQILSNEVEIEWPPRSGHKIEVPEIDKAKYIAADLAIAKMHKSQDEFVRRLAEQLDLNLEKELPAQSTLF